MALDRSVQAEYLGLTQEQYILLTQQAFWPRAYFSLTTGAPVSEAEYRARIGVRPTHEYFGYPTEAAMLDLDEQVKGGLTFVSAQLLPRTGVSYSELSDLLRTRYMNPAFPSGEAQRLTEAVRFRYRFLQGLVDTTSSDPRRRFRKLVDFLAKEQPTLGRDALYRWAHCWFDRIGGLIVLESPGTRWLPLHGYLAYWSDETLIRRWELHEDGSVTDVDGGAVVGRVTDAGLVADLTGAPFHPDGTLDVLDRAGELIGHVEQTGVMKDTNGKTLTWVTLDSCDLERVRLTHLDGTGVIPHEYGRLHRFIRLWRSTAWTIQETDQALSGLSANAGTRPPSPAAGTATSWVSTASPTTAPPARRARTRTIHPAHRSRSRRRSRSASWPSWSPCAGCWNVPDSPWIVCSVSGQTSVPVAIRPCTRGFSARTTCWRSIPSSGPTRTASCWTRQARSATTWPGCRLLLGLSGADITTLIEWRRLPDALTLASATVLYRHAVLARHLAGPDPGTRRDHRSVRRPVCRRSRGLDIPGGLAGRRGCRARVPAPRLRIARPR
ncbi:DUF3659 domain-containing protein [Streptomyces sp. L7]